MFTFFTKMKSLYQSKLSFRRERDRAREKRTEK